MNAPTVEHRKSTPKIPDSTPPAAPAPAIDTRDRFETRGELGRGGMGRVDDVYDHALGRQVAIKHVLSLTEVDVARFEREARITARLEHPGIVPVHDIGRGADGTPYYVMRRVDGEPLSDLVENKPLAERLRLVPNMLAACDAAAFAHARGVVHRDIKPTNILVGAFGETLLIDWGLAREVAATDDKPSATAVPDSNLTRAGTVAGTPGFMSPEQARGETVDARADVFALGATLFYLLAGQLPWHGGSTEMIDHVGAGRPPDWRLMPAEVPPDLRAIVEKAMSADLQVRYADAGALAADLRQFTLGNLVTAYDYGLFARLVRFVRRHRASVAVGAISFVVLAVVGVVSVRRVLAERDDANTARALAEKRQQEARAAADRLLIAHARELVDVDPTEAVAALRTLPADSPSWKQAWTVASAAFYRGIPTGFVGLDEAGLPQIAADDAHAFVIGFQTGHTIVIDVANRTSRDLGKLGRISYAGWLDNSHILVGIPSGGIILDITSGNRRTLNLPLVEQPSVHVNREGLAVFHLGKQLFELRGADGTPQLIDSNVDAYTPSPQLDAALIRRGSKRELHVAGATIAMPDLAPEWLANDPYYIVRKDLVATYEVPDVIIWDVVDGKVVQRGVWKQQKLTQAILYADGSVWAAGHQGYERLDRFSFKVPGEFSTFVQTRTGALFAANDGSLIVRDDHGLYRLGRRHAAYSRFDQSIDGKLVMATTMTGEMLLWDLSQLRPPTLLLDGDETPVLLDAKALWTMSFGGFSRRDVTTGARTLALKVETTMAILVETADLHTVAALDYNLARLSIAAPGVPVFDEDLVNNLGVDEHSVIFGRTNGELARWEASTGKTVLATFDQPVEVVAVNDGYAIAALANHDLVRIDAKTRAQERAPLPGSVDGVSLTPSGDAWIVAAGIAYRWKPKSRAPVALATPEPVDGLRQIGGVAVFHSPRSLLVYEHDEPRVIAKTSKYVGDLDGGLLVVTDAKGTVSIVDIATGSSFDLPLTLAMTGSPALGVGNRVGYVSGIVAPARKQYALIDLNVPREPAALQRWLATITNALPVAGSEAVAWPRPTR